MSQEIVKIETELKYNEKQTTDSTSTRDSTGSATETGTQVVAGTGERKTERALTAKSVQRKTGGEFVNIAAQISYVIRIESEVPVDPDKASSC